MGVIKKDSISGLVGNVIFRKVHDQQIVQGKSGKGKVKQTPATKKAALLFGKASTLGAFIRKQSVPLLSVFYDYQMSPRLVSVLRRILKESFDETAQAYNFQSDAFERLVGFDFNTASPFEESLRLLPESKIIDGQLVLTFPEFTIEDTVIFPPHAKYCHIRIHVNQLDLRSGFYQVNTQTARITIDSSNTVHEKQVVTFPVAAGCLCLVTIGLQHFDIMFGDTISYNRVDFSPAVICAASISPGVFDCNGKKGWRKQERLVF